MTNYSPEPVPQTAGSAELQEYLMRELSRISAAMEVADAVTLPNTTMPPSRPEEGTIIYADGTTFDPGAGEGLYVFKNGNWVSLENDNIANNQFGFRNKIINGNYDIWQRATTQSTSGLGSDDRWQNVFAVDSATTSQQVFTVGQTDVPGNPTYWSRTTGSSVAGASAFVIKYQFIESVKTLAGKLATITFWAKADSAGRQIAVEVYQFFGAGGAPSAAVDGSSNGQTKKFTLTTSWQKISFTALVPSIAGKTLGTTHDGGLGVLIWMDAGSDFNTRTDNLGQKVGGWSIDIARVSVVEGNALSEPDPFSPRHIQQELALCQRYYYQMGGETLFEPMGVGQAYSTINAQIYIPFPVTMRVAPTLAVSSTLGVNNAAGTAVAVTGISINAASTKTARMTVTVAAGLVAGDATQLYANNSLAGRLGFSSEL